MKGIIQKDLSLTAATTVTAATGCTCVWFVLSLPGTGEILSTVELPKNSQKFSQGFSIITAKASQRSNECVVVS